MSSVFKVNSRANWAAQNPVLMDGEAAIEAQTNNLKIGNGKSTWSQLPYFSGPGYWGSFWDETSQTATANTPTSVYLRSEDPNSRGIHIVSQNRITFDHAGVYSLTFSIQFSNIGVSIHDINVWLRKNDSGASGDVPATDSKFSIIASHGGVAGNVIGTVNFVLPVVANDYLELIWATSNADAYIHAEAAAVSPFAHPSIPGVVCTVVQVASA
jgi:hyaluronoglucosaminidase